MLKAMKAANETKRKFLEIKEFNVGENREQSKCFAEDKLQKIKSFEQEGKNKFRN